MLNIFLVILLQTLQNTLFPIWFVKSIFRVEFLMIVLRMLIHVNNMMKKNYFIP